MSERNGKIPLKGLWRRMQPKSGGPSRKPKIEKRRATLLREKFETYTHAITFAEAGMHGYAQDLLRARQAEKAKVMVVGHGAGFSSQVVDYAAGFAARMGYGIVALNVTPEKSTPHHKALQKALRQKSGSQLERLQRLCEEKQIPFTHVVKSGELEESIKEVHEEIRRVEFMVTDPESCPEAGEVSIPVFCMAH